MSQHNYWNDMNIPRDDQDKIYISDEIVTPILLDQGHQCEVYKEDIDDSLVDDISQFYRSNNIMSSGNRILVSKSNIIDMMNSGSYCGVLTYNGSIIGCMISLPLTISYSNCPIKSSYTTHLCIKEGLRSKGYAMILIRSIMMKGYGDGIRHGYYLTDEENHRCSTRIGSWYRPVNCDKARKAGFYIPETNARVLKMTYRTSSVNTISHRLVDINQLELIKRWSKSKINYSPTQDEWNMLQRGYDTYTIFKRDTPIAVVILNTFSMIVARTGNETSITYLCYLSIDPSMMTYINSIIVEVSIIAKLKGSSIIYGYSLGSLYPASMRRMCNLIDTSGDKVLEFYNSSVKLDDSDINLPLL